MKEKFKSFNFRVDALEKIERANNIIEDFQSQGYRMTLRQLYYQFVSRNWITNEEKSYKKLAEIVSNGRLAGLIDWDAIEDRGRQPDAPSEFRDLAQLTRVALNSYRLPRWAGQNSYVELWVEKQALAGVLQPLASEFHVTLMVNKGYSSQSAMYASAQRFLENSRGDDYLFYLGDHDPSGEDMVRDIRDRMEMFGVHNITVKKVALTMAQIEEHNPPPNPAKITDPRAGGYIAKFGNSSWEVDALDPPVLVSLIRDSFLPVYDQDLMAEVIAQEETDKESLLEAVSKLVGKKP